METTNKYKLLSYFYISISLVLVGIGVTYNAFDFLYTFITVSVLVIGVLPLVHEKGIEWSTYISRILVGSLFVVSGLIKANDPLGFSYKLEEYFAESALNWPFFEPYSLAISILVASSEIILGFAVLFGGKSKLTNWSLLVMILFFSWLTFYTAQCDPNGVYTVVENGVEVERGVTCVTDCGCFGDALKGSIGRSLTPWESFKKDILLLVFVIILIVRSSFIKINTKTDDLIILPLSILFVVVLGGMLFGWWFPLIFTIATFIIYLIIKQLKLSVLDMDWQVALMVSVVSFGFAWYCLTNLPQMDFRPYGINKSIPLQMRTAEEIEGVEAPVFVYDYVLENKLTKELKQVRSDAYMGEKMYEDTLWAFKETKGESYMIKDGYMPPIMSFNIGDEEQTHQLLESAEPVFVLVSYDIAHSDKGVQDEVNEFVKLSKEKGIRFIGASASLYEDIESFKKETGNTFEYLEGDEKILKTVIRSNPGLVLLQNGVVLGKWHYNNFPEIDKALSKIKNINEVTSDAIQDEIRVQMVEKDGVFWLPIKINGLAVEVVYDTGASSVSISSEKAAFLYDDGRLKDGDVIGEVKYQMADGGISTGLDFVIRKLEIGGVVLEDIQASVVGNDKAPLLLGQSALMNFSKVTVDNKTKELILTRK